MMQRELDELGRDLWAWQKPIVATTAASVRRAFLVNGHGPSVALVLSRSQSRVASRMRAVVCWVLRQHNHWSYQELGRAVGRSHKTVLSACRRVEADQGLLDVATVVLSCMRGGQRD